MSSVPRPPSTHSVLTIYNSVLTPAPMTPSRTATAAAVPVMASAVAAAPTL